VYGQYGWIIALVVGFVIWRLLSTRSNPSSRDVHGDGNWQNGTGHHKHDGFGSDSSGHHGGGDGGSGFDF
jgi:hypothetical protein